MDSTVLHPAHSNVMLPLHQAPAWHVTTLPRGHGLLLFRVAALPQATAVGQTAHIGPRESVI